MEWIEQSDYSSESVNLITGTTITAYIETINARSIDSVDDTLLSDLKRFRDEDNLPGFVEKYGTHYISAMEYGGSALSRIHIKGKTREVKTEFEGSLTAAYKSAGVSGPAKFAEDISRLEKRSDITVTSDYYLKGSPP